ncbi:MAG: alpha/beta hydrolase [Candidatus Paceibacterota bacterium]|jgi:pimeloyl-ACP methyl ester carboxylesterase
MTANVNKISERDVRINDLNVHYRTAGNGELAVIFLHGWGIDSERYTETAEYMLREAESCGLKAKIIIPDLPGFGKSDEPRSDWNLDDYVEFTDKFIETATRGRGFELIKNIMKNINLKSLASGGLTSSKEVRPPVKIILLGHSFGGRIAIKYAVKYPEKIEKLILTGAAGIKHPLKVKQKVLSVMAKIGKKIFSVATQTKLPVGRLASASKDLLYRIAREKDYNSASPRMKEIMKNVIEEDIGPILNHIKTPTLLLWGRDDHSTPLSDGNTMHESIRGSIMTVIDNANHSLPYQKPEDFAKIAISAIKNEAQRAS